MYLNTVADGMTVWPIYAFPYASSTQSVDLGQLKVITTTILNILNSPLPAALQPSGAVSGEQITVPGLLQQPNPYISNAATSVAPNPAVNDTIAAQTVEPSFSGVAVTSSARAVANTSVTGLLARQVSTPSKAKKPALISLHQESRAGHSSFAG